MTEQSKKVYLYAAVFLALAAAVVLLLLPKSITLKGGQKERPDVAPVSGAGENVFRGQTEQTDAGATTEIPAPAEVLSTSFSYPYPLSWSDGSAVFAPRQYKFDLTGVSLGEMTTEQELIGEDGTKYAPGSEVYALALHFKITNTVGTAIPTIPPMNLRLVKNEEGDMMIPATRQFYFPSLGNSSLLPNSTAENGKAVFIVTEDQKEFLLTTGGIPNIYFYVRVADGGGLEVEKVPTGGG